MEEAIQDFRKPIEAGTINVKSGEVSRHTGFVVGNASRDITDEIGEEENTLIGLPASAGVVEGPAAVIAGYEDLTKVKDGTILVCPHMSPALTIVFSTIKGLVTDCGGMLTPAATVAREYGIPAVVGTAVATDSIHDGDLLRVNGTEGRVEIIAKAH
jgi:pyruvate,water dikinase